MTEAEIAAAVAEGPGPLIIHPPRFDLVAHLERQRAFSLRTFGPGARTKGVVDHISRELVEVEKSPADLMEWADVILLALDGAWRAGHEPTAIANAIAAKQARNEARQWPDWRTADPDKAIEHVRVGEETTAAGGAETTQPAEVIDTCEGCSVEIRVGDVYFPCEDGPSLCRACAPTYADLLSERDFFIDEDGAPATPGQRRAWYDAHIAAGGKPEDSMARAQA